MRNSKKYQEKTEEPFVEGFWFHSTKCVCGGGKLISYIFSVGFRIKSDLLQSRLIEESAFDFKPL